MGTVALGVGVGVGVGVVVGAGAMSSIIGVTSKSLGPSVRRKIMCEKERGARISYHSLQTSFSGSRDVSDFHSKSEKNSGTIKKKFPKIVVSSLSFGGSRQQVKHYKIHKELK